jgi:hypothetical protein
MKRTMINRMMLAPFLFLLESAQAYAETDLLPSWNDGKTKQSIMDFVKRVTAKGGKDSVPPAERIAVFDNDGTLWAEQPIYCNVEGPGVFWFSERFVLL